MGEDFGAAGWDDDVRGACEGDVLGDGEADAGVAGCDQDGFAGG